MSQANNGLPGGREDWINAGRQVLSAESTALLATAGRLGDAFASAVGTMLESSGKVIVTGMGKSGHVARKVAATLSSTGTPAAFLHPSEALHGDSGMMRAGDCLLAIAYGGETHEVVAVCRYARRLGLPIIAVTGKPESSLAQLAHHVIDGYVEREAEPLNLAPTSSSTVAMALGDALAVALMSARRFTPEDFASLHPGGNLGRRLSRVADHMHGLDRLGVIGPAANFHEILAAVTRHNFGIAAVVDGSGGLSGAISDGDLRRALMANGAEALTASARELMSPRPRTIGQEVLALDAVTLMNDARITSLFVTGAQEGQNVLPKLVGLIRLHDLLAARII